MPEYRLTGEETSGEILNILTQVWEHNTGPALALKDIDSKLQAYYASLVPKKMKEKLALYTSECYSQELSACPNHPIFQPQKFINYALSLFGGLIEEQEK